MQYGCCWQANIISGSPDTKAIPPGSLLLAPGSRSRNLDQIMESNQVFNQIQRAWTNKDAPNSVPLLAYGVKAHLYKRGAVAQTGRS